jgi:maltooligosyltrehalose trehalohydrolase
MENPPKYYAEYDAFKKQCDFAVFAPLQKQMVLQVVSPFKKEFDMEKSDGYFLKTIDADTPDIRYFLKPDGGKPLPDPASHFQPNGVHTASQIVDHAQFRWSDEKWKGLPMRDMIIYELHVGTFTPEGTFDAIIPRLDLLKDVGINALELMPVAQFPGERNWGYDGVHPYAVQNSYGGPDAFKKLVDECHAREIAVILDVVYNHLGPEGNYFSQFAPYFTDQYCTPWGDAVNFDGEWSDGVRDFFANNILFWFENYHVDGLRCDAIHMVFDNGAVHFWEYASLKVEELSKKLGRKFHLIAESDKNSPRVTDSPERGGYGFHAQWLDDFHHALYTLLDPKGRERYYDFGALEQLLKAYTDGFVHSGEWVKFRKRKHGASSKDVPGDKFIVFNLNHDQVGNRVGGERLCMLVDFEKVKLAAAAIMLSPYVPMLFMGEEYADDTPFFYFVSHTDEALIKAVQEGRKNEFKDFGFEKDPPDPQSEKTFKKSIIHWEKRGEGKHKIILEWHKELIRLRKSNPALKNFLKKDVRAEAIGDGGFVLFRKSDDGKNQLACVFNLSENEILWTAPENYKKILDSKDQRWMSDKTVQPCHSDELTAGSVLKLQPHSVMVYTL